MLMDVSIHQIQDVKNIIFMIFKKREPFAVFLSVLLVDENHGKSERVYASRRGS